MELNFILKIHFDGDFEGDKNTITVARNIMDALVLQVNTHGMAPEECDTFTTKLKLLSVENPKIWEENTF